MSKPKILIISAATPDYFHKWDRCLMSQARWANRLEYSYSCHNTNHKEDYLIHYLRYKLLLEAMHEFDWVMWLDADCKVAENAPDVIDSLPHTEGHIFMGCGRTHRLNSGVILSRSTQIAVNFCKRIYSLRHTKSSVSPEIYDNGHIITEAPKYGVTLLPKEWNNSESPDMIDYIRHFTGPIMRGRYDN